MNVAAIIVTHNSTGYIEKCIMHLQRQTHPVDSIVIVDSGSKNTKYLETYNTYDNIKVLRKKNIGFAAANNIGYSEIEDSVKYVIFINPDTFVDFNFVENAITLLEQDQTVGIVSGRLLGYIMSDGEPNSRIDSTGVFRKFYGRWYDRGQNCIDSDQYLKSEYVPALCGALLFCRKDGLQTLGGKVFDEDFFLYKEDIELSVRLRKKGWNLLYSPELKAFHCRGWKKRSDMPFRRKMISAKSEILLYKKHPSPYIIWAYLKYFVLLITKF